MSGQPKTRIVASIVYDRNTPTPLSRGSGNQHTRLHAKMKNLPFWYYINALADCPEFLWCFDEGQRHGREEAAGSLARSEIASYSLRNWSRNDTLFLQIMPRISAAPLTTMMGSSSYTSSIASSRVVHEFWRHSNVRTSVSADYGRVYRDMYAKFCNRNYCKRFISSQYTKTFNDEWIQCTNVFLPIIVDMDMHIRGLLGKYAVTHLSCANSQAN